jgi:hypothetical protein
LDLGALSHDLDAKISNCNSANVPDLGINTSRSSKAIGLDKLQGLNAIGFEDNFSQKGLMAVRRRNFLALIAVENIGGSGGL